MTGDKAASVLPECECDVDYNCGRHEDYEAQMMASAAALVRGAVRAGIILPAGVEREETR